MSEWIEWKGGERPVPRDVLVECALRNGKRIGPFRADSILWGETGGGGNVVWYRTVTAESGPTPTVTAGGWVEWHGGCCPVPGSVLVECELRNGERIGPHRAHSVLWGHNTSGVVPGGEVVRYRTVTAGGWIEWTGGECPVPGDVRVECELRNGDRLGPIRARSVLWEHGGYTVPGENVVRYRTVAEESDPTGRQPGEPGAKLDAGKSPIRRGLLEYFPRACLAVAEVSAHGAEKYSWNGWETVPDGVNRYGDAMVRHSCKAVIEGPRDADSGLLHAAHEAWNALARLELMLREDK